MENVFWAKKLNKIWHLLITEKFLFWTFPRCEVWSCFESKGWWKDDIYWLLNSSCFELGDGKYGLFSVKKLMERWYLLALFELSMIFQDLGNMLFVQWRSRWRLWRLRFKPTSRIRETKITRSRDQIVMRLYGVGLLIVCYHPARFEGYR